MNRRIAIFFPGIGYNADKPLLYYSRKLTAKYGYEEKLIPCAVYAGANHSLETDDPIKNVEYLMDVMGRTEDFISEQMMPVI
ncbi:MAG: hypothetical protein Q4E57_06595 [Eubacteriales bacterium]|nr:hypothetical protein [Eubacteriales bacterium]